MRRLLGLVLVAVAAAACAADRYPLLTPAGATQWSPTALGTPVRGVVLYLQPRPGDRIELVSAEAVGLRAGADVAFYFAPGIRGANGSITIGDRLEPLPGAVVAVDAAASPRPGNDVGVVVELTPRVPGTFEVSSVRLGFRINGGSVEIKEGITETLTVCAGDPTPTECAPAE
jgi:hypothetical protein